MSWFDPSTIVEALGPYLVLGVALIIFIETAFVFASFLPGDSLLFVAGLALVSDSGPLVLAVAVPSLWFAAALGSQVGYYTGRMLGPRLFDNPRGRILTPRTVQRTHTYFVRYGNRAIIVARFVPIIRALVPMLAGISRLSPATFTKFNSLGALIWVGILVLGGYFLGSIPWVHDNLDAAIIVVIIVTSLPFPLELLREWRSQRR
ncbi:MAG: hypothetical protein RIS25_668 [Actinomycetota bacterium]